jgi:hypothetical protein
MMTEHEESQQLVVVVLAESRCLSALRSTRKAPANTDAGRLRLLCRSDVLTWACRLCVASSARHVSLVRLDRSARRAKRLTVSSLKVHTLCTLYMMYSHTLSLTTTDVLQLVERPTGLDKGHKGADYIQLERSVIIWRPTHSWRPTTDHFG